jgi:hypothetical protein
MRLLGRWKFRRGAVAALGALAVSVAGYTAPAGATPATRTPDQTGSVSPTPAAGTPQLVQRTSTEQRIRQLVQCGGTMYAVGIFGEVAQDGNTYTRNNVFSFSATAPFTMTSWAPDVSGRVNSIAFNGSDCSDAYIGGKFTSVSGTPVKNIAEVDTTTGAVDPAFGTSASGAVDTLLGVAGHLLVGGQFTWINGSHGDPYMASVSPVTGKNDRFLQLGISGYYHYCNYSDQCTNDVHSAINNQQLSHGGTLDLVEGDFTSVSGLPRQQIFMLNLATDPATVTGWTSPEWDGSDGNLPQGYPYQCTISEAYYIRSAAWSPDDSTVYIATTGYNPWNVSAGSYPRIGLCDAAAAFPATQTSVTHLWVEYTGCDSYYSVAADDGTVYVAGHPRYAENPDGCDGAGPGAIRDHGLQGLDPSSGSLELNSAGKPMYRMARANADDMLITSAGLWIASSNRYGAQACGHSNGHSGICFLRYHTS